MSKQRLTRRDFLRVAAGTAGMGLLAACAAPAPAAPAPAQEEAPAATEAESAPAGVAEQEGVLWGLQYDPHVEGYERMAALFKNKTGATLKVEPQAWPLETKLIAALAAGTQPDVACIMGKMCTPLYIQGVLMPLDDIVYAAVNVRPEDVFFIDAVQAYTWEGKMYGTPFEAGGLGNVVNVPADEVAELGLADQYPPTNGEIWWPSYEDMWELAKALQVEEDGRVVRWGLSSKGWDSSSYLGILRSLLAPKDMDWWDPVNESFNVVSDEGIQAMKFFAETPVQMGIETELDQSHVDAALAGKVALARGNGTPFLQGDELGYSYNICGVPKVDGDNPPLSCSEAGWGFVAPNAAMHPDIAVEFLKLMATEEGQTEMCKTYGGITVIAWKGLVNKFDHWTNPDPDSKGVKFAKVYQQQLQPLSRYYGEGFGYAGEVDTIFGEVCSEVRQQNMNSEQACQTIQERLEAQRAQWLEDTKAV